MVGAVELQGQILTAQIWRLRRPSAIQQLGCFHAIGIEVGEVGVHTEPEPAGPDNMA